MRDFITGILIHMLNMKASEAKEMTGKKIALEERERKEKEKLAQNKEQEKAQENRKNNLEFALQLVKESINKNLFSTYVFCSYNCKSYEDQYLIEDLEELGYKVTYEVTSFSDDDSGTPILNISWE